jgi:DNA-3-methyladenine glycosylase
MTGSDFFEDGNTMMARGGKRSNHPMKSADAHKNGSRARKTRRLSREFFERRTLLVARELLGKIIVHRIGKSKISVMITETEAYIGERDLASHARFGRTKRNAVMYGHAGVWYPYFIYGMHWMLNVTSEGFDRPAAVLIRAGILAEADHIIRGPGLLAKALQVDASFYGKSATSGDLYIEDRGYRPKKIIRTPRIGIDYAGAYKDKKWRFVIPNSRSEIHFVK